jgi:ParB-like nuclease domain
MPSERWPNGGSRAWRKLRAQVLERDGGRCTHVDDDSGERCEKTARLEVHHLRPGPAIDADLEDLITVCRPHHPPPDAAWQAASAEAAAREAVSKLDVQELDIRSLMPALWNANAVTRETMRRIRNSIRQYGIVENLVVRPHPEFDGKYEVLSGNHRLQILKQLRVKTAPCHVVQLDDALARVLAQTLNRTRGSDDPHKLADLMDQIHAALPKARIEEFLEPMAKLPAKGEGAMEKLLAAQKAGEGMGYQFRPIHPIKLGLRLESCCHAPKMGKALELFAGRGQLTFWYSRLFEKVVRVDTDAEGQPDHNMPASDYLRTKFLEDAPFDLIDFDDEGNPFEELDVFFELIKQHPQPPFVLCVTDGLSHRLKMIRNVPTDLMKVYRWPERAAADKRLYLRCPELMDHGIRARAEQAGYSAELISMEWKPGKSATFGSWLIGPEQDTRHPIERDAADPEETPEAWGAWRVTLKPRPGEPQPPVQPLDDTAKKKK